jgi:hypothetical protein
VGGRSETTLQGSREGREGEVTGFAFLAAAAKSQKEHWSSCSIWTPRF